MSTALIVHTSSSASRSVSPGRGALNLSPTTISSDRVAFEVQYSALTPDAWRRRHESYRQQDILDVWLFGHHGAQLKLAKDGRPKLNQTHQAVIETGIPALWFNPFENQIAIAVGEGFLLQDRDFSNIWEMEATGEYRSVISDAEDPELRMEPLDAFTVNPVTGLVSPQLADLIAQTKELREQNTRVRANFAQQAEYRARVRLLEEQRQAAKRAAWQTRQRGLAANTADAIRKHVGDWNGSADDRRSVFPQERPRTFRCVSHPSIHPSSIAASKTVHKKQGAGGNR